ncbi:MAG: class I SAM-dependent methyltransferase [Oligoflexia bacterium]|nr:class I SAM-dependent methyltransferase [Oligoflexia bacterium]
MRQVCGGEPAGLADCSWGTLSPFPKMVVYDEGAGGGGLSQGDCLQDPVKLRDGLRGLIEDGRLPSAPEKLARFAEIMQALLTRRDFVRPQHIAPQQIAPFFGNYPGPFGINADVHLPLIFPGFTAPSAEDLARLKARDTEEPSKSFTYGTMPWGETAVLREIVRAMKPRTVLEIGTNIGLLTREIVDVCPEDAVVFTLDLPPSMRERAFQPLDDINLSYVRQEQTDQDVGREVKPPYTRAAQVIQLLGDSQVFNFNALRNMVDLVIVDGLHSYPAPLVDTRHALELVNLGGVVAWDDYGKLFRLAGVTLTLLEMAVKERRQIYWVNHNQSLSTGLAFHVTP